jgi:hypothetical protein
VLLLAPLLALVVGCHGKAPSGEVSGRLTVAGVPVQFGTISFLNEQGQVATGNIENGAYRAIEVPTGSVKITVQSVKLGMPSGNPKFGPLPSSPPQQGKFVPVPNRYTMPKTSPLQLDVVAGPQNKDFDLTEK